MLRWMAITLLVFACMPSLAQDTDHDGLSDVMEQSLLERFEPRFMVSSGDCGVRPASFVPDNKTPQVIASDGTIYGQAFIRSSDPMGGVVVELHYYDLWAVDCGRMGHPLDAEHVSVLVSASGLMMPASGWKASYWYAAAHEDTVCDASTAIRASVVGAEEKGATVWVSAGKHAAYLDEKTCRWGCGGDRCRSMHPLKVMRIVNLGELDAAMNGAVWATSNQWPLRDKFATDFSDEWMSRLMQLKRERPVQMNASYSGVKGGIYGANAAVDGAEIGMTHTGSALTLADGKTEGALQKSADAVGHSLKKSKNAVGRFLRKPFKGESEP
ncbi:hypothetical protein [Terriglobus tenax]|uniref:hypothetical protein n=1 Tax=Terriglobus tenax TaxID=1111115 RepID=UPI0021E0EB8F|nr:hypothetical protein [Terriglobus tenax]